MQHICKHQYMIKLIKITRKYIKWAYTTDKHNLIFGIPLLQECWRWHCYSHSNYLWLNMHQATFDYSNLEAYISKTKNDRNKQISDSESWHLGGYSWLKTGSKCTNNIHAQRDVQKHCFFFLPLYYLKLIFIAKEYLMPQSHCAESTAERGRM